MCVIQSQYLKQYNFLFRILLLGKRKQAVGPANSNGAERLFTEQVEDECQRTWISATGEHSIPGTELSARGPFESHDLLQKGLPCVKNELLPSHP